MPPVRQSAALPVRDGLVCLVTSSNGRRWVIPKGHIDPGHTAASAAVIEAHEEAGLVGTLDPEQVGSYLYEKLGRNYQVSVFVLRVTDAQADWPERAVRRREWVTAEEAVARVAEPGLQAIIRGVMEAAVEV